MSNEVLHPLDVDDAAAISAMRAAIAAKPVQMTRAVYDWLFEQTPAAADVTYEPDTVGGVRGVWARPANARPGTSLLYVHGGAYVLGSANAYRHLAGQVATRAGAAAFIPDYRLAPEHPFPAAVDDARAALMGLVGSGLDGLGVVGDSAGGGLALAVLAEAGRTWKHAVRTTPRLAGVLFSPWTDLAFTGESLAARASEDPAITQPVLAAGAAKYLAGQSATDPLASPLYGDGDGLPPVQVHVGTAEILLDDSRRLATLGPIEVHVWEGMVHVFPRNVATLKAARSALDLAGAYLRERLS